MSAIAHLVRIFIVEDHPLIRSGLNNCINSSKDLEVIGSAVDGESALREIQSLRPEIVLMDLSLPRISGLEATQILAATNPLLKVIWTTDKLTPDFIRKGKLLRVQGFIDISCPPNELLAALRLVASGIECCVDNHFKPPTPPLWPSVGTEKLSKRESEIIALIAEGHSNKEIAGILGTSRRTVEVQRLGISTKLHISTTAMITKFAVKHGLSAL